MNKYHKSYVYKIWSPSQDLQYIGSTIQGLSRRLSKHKTQQKQFLGGKKKFCSVNKVLDCPDYRIVLIEECKCENRQELLRKESEYIKDLNCVNKCLAFATEEDHKIRNKKYREEHKEEHKQYYKNNKDKLRQQNRQWYQDNKEKSLQYQKTYRENNKDSYKKYQQENKDKINARRRELRKIKIKKVFKKVTLSDIN